jgi:hypothetical protein
VSSTLRASSRWTAAARLVAAASCLTLGGTAAAQGRITNAAIENRPAAEGVERAVRAVAARGTASWIGYRVPMVAGTRHLCCADAPQAGGSCCGMCRLERGSGVTLTDVATPGLHVALEPPTELLVLARVEAGEIVRVRTFTVDCEIDAGGMPLVWLTDVKPEDSVAWLVTLVTAAADAGRQGDRVAAAAIGAVALHDLPSVDRVLGGFVALTAPESRRRETAFWLGTARGEPGAQLLARMVAQDPSDAVREQALFGLSVSTRDSAQAALLSAARDDRSPRIRGRALFWLAQRAGQRVEDTVAAAADRDPDTEVKKQAVFALSRMPKDEGIPKLIAVARTHANPQVRKQAMFWLGQSKDPRAVAFFEEILTRK